MNTNQVLRKFMTKMDRLWKQYDQAVDMLPRGDALAFKRYSDDLDKFFVCYWHSFNDAVDDANVDELLRSCDSRYEESVRILESTWKNTTDSLLRRAIEIKDDSRSRSLPNLLSVFQKAERLLRQARKGVTINERIENNMEAAEFLEDFISKAEAAK